MQRFPRVAGWLAAGRTLTSPVVDVNHARIAVLSRLPGVDRSLAQRIVEARSARRGFTSIEELSRELDLPAAVAEALRDRVAFVRLA
jgi:DNA uptake protein ComE-like DNA-binding protein